MEFTNELYKYVQADAGPRAQTLAQAIDTMLLLLAPITPHITAELWSWLRVADGDQSAAAVAHIHEEPWPLADPAKLTVDTVTMVVQVNGKVRDRIEVDAGIDYVVAEVEALSSDKVVAALGGATPKKVIVRSPSSSTSWCERARSRTRGPSRPIRSVRPPRQRITAIACPRH